MKNLKTSLATPLARVRGLGAAKSGTHHWWLQRVTSVALIALSIYPLVMLMIYAAYGDYKLITSALHSPYTAAAVALFLIVGFHHTASGLQVVIEDYVHCECAKTVSLLIVKFASVALTVLGLVATLKIMLGA